MDDKSLLFTFFIFLRWNKVSLVSGSCFLELKRGEVYVRASNFSYGYFPLHNILKQTKLLPNHKRFVHVFGERLQEDWVSIIKDKEAKKLYIYNSRGFCTASNR